ncbi:hypothetical protein WUBG_19272, partial [Wuchereria bancrofti]
MATLTRRNDKTVVENLTGAEVSQLIKEHEEKEKNRRRSSLLNFELRAADPYSFDNKMKSISGTGGTHFL